MRASVVQLSTAVRFRVGWDDFHSVDRRLSEAISILDMVFGSGTNTGFTRAQAAKRVRRLVAQSGPVQPPQVRVML